jgi:hypothetical protein
MTLYLLDANVLREFGPNCYRNVRTWLGTVDDAALQVSVMTLLVRILDPFKAKRGALMV